MKISFDDNHYTFTQDDMSTNMNYTQVFNELNNIFNQQEHQDISMLSPMIALHQAAQTYMMKNFTSNSTSRLRSDSIFSINSTISYLSNETLYPNSEYDGLDLSRRASYQSYQTFQTDSLTLIETGSIHLKKHNIRSSMKAAKILGIDTDCNSINNNRSYSINSSKITRSRSQTISTYKSKRRENSIKSIFQSKLGLSKSFDYSNDDSFSITILALKASLHAWVDLLTDSSRSKSLFRPYKRTYLALNKNIIYKFHHDDPHTISSDTFTLSSISSINILPNYCSKSGRRWEMELINPNTSWILRFPSQSLLLYWLDSLSMAQNRVSHNTLSSTHLSLVDPLN